MGSYNVACSASNVSINCGDKVRVFPLVRSRYGGPLSGSTVVSNDGAEALFRAMFLPVTCYYDDYGSIRDIEKSATTEMIERYTGMDAEKYINTLLGYHESEGDPKIATDASMYVLDEVYEALIGSGMKESSLYDQSFAVVLALKDLGFESYHTVTSEEMRDGDDVHGVNRYKSLWKHPSSDKYFIGADSFSTSIIELKDGKYGSLNDNTFSVSDLSEVWMELVEFQLEVESMKSISANSYQTREDVSKYRTAVELFQDSVRRERARPDVEPSGLDLSPLMLEMQEKMKVERFKAAENPYLPGFYGKGYLFGKHHIVGDFPFDFYGPVISGEREDLLEGFIHEMSEFKDFRHEMFRVNKMFQPVMNGPQCGDSEAVKFLADKVSEICAARIKEDEDEDCEDE